MTKTELSGDPTNVELREAVLALRERVSELEGKSDSDDHKKHSHDALDHYDEEAMSVLSEPAGKAHPRQVMRAYEVAGIVNDDTKKRRARRLKRLAEEKDL